ncbi:hypothetical protein [Pedobacter sp. GR22-10]|uniref:hypothetical protein n=1 Tax=Pedobacter sp. GR22-10 TaxID=2994472 RepID=UPI00224711FF|nr:hypothetical protein [Pedobacter sp. GR22-10]MCX2431221.1 hypothetical protein [Pedobacter sp. GR22-10]
MELKFKSLLLISVLTTFTALIASFVALPDQSGYAGLFFIGLSPVFIGVFIIWTLILSPVVHRKAGFNQLMVILLSTIVFEYVVVIFAMWFMSSDQPGYHLNTFLSDCADLFRDIAILVCMVVTAATYSLLWTYLLKTHKKQPELKPHEHKPGDFK